jgi:hypothetical protein
MRPLALLLLSISSLFAAPYTVTSSGIFGSTAPVSTFSGPNQTWSLSFVIDSNPVPIAANAFRSTVPISGFTYLLNGSAVSTDRTRADFFPSPFGGLAIDDLPMEFWGPQLQLFSGPTTSPTIVPGVYTGTFSAGGARVNDATLTISNAAVPEPGSIGLSVLGLIGLGLLRRRG